MKKQRTSFLIQLVLGLILFTMTASAPMETLSVTNKLSGFIVRLNPTIKTITIQTNTGGTRSLTVNTQTKIEREGKISTFDRLRVGDKVDISYDKPSMVALTIQAKVELRKVKGVILRLDTAKNLLSILPSNKTASITLTVNKATRVNINGKKDGFSSLVPGSIVSADYVPISRRAISIDAKLELHEIEGTIITLDPARSTLSIMPSHSNTSMTLFVKSETKIYRNGISAALTDLKIRDNIEAKYISASRIITSLSAKSGSVTPTAIPTITLTPQPTQTPPTATPTPVTNTHASIASYDGPQTCINCHATQADNALHSEHMQWSGKWTQINTYCTAPLNSEFACLNCHAGTGKITNLTTQDVDCLVCHSDTYQRTLGPKTVELNITDWQGTSRTVMAPEKVNGNYQFQPDFNKMPAGTTMLDVARNVTKPTTKTCLRCHAKAGGGDGSKRGDIFSGLASPTLDPKVDVHLSPTGANLTCLSCHKTSNHQIPGKGIDLRISEGGNVDCTQCHDQYLHRDNKINQHTDRVACQTCHIPKFGKVAGTEMSRDWRIPAWSPAGLDGQGAWVGEEDRQFDVTPSYKFWNGQSFVYSAGQSLAPEADGSFYEAKAFGSINSGKLYPIKVHTAFQPVQNGTNTLVMYDVFWNFLTGKYDESALRGLDSMGTGGSYTWSLVKTDQLITHGVEPKASSVQCAACHETRTQMDLRTMGYTLKDTQSKVCTQCHEAEENPGFYSVHNEHVTEKKIDCSSCHTFSRPER
jgi:hypothetical protein